MKAPSDEDLTYSKSTQENSFHGLRFGETAIALQVSESLGMGNKGGRGPHIL